MAYRYLPEPYEELFARIRELEYRLDLVEKYRQRNFEMNSVQLLLDEEACEDVGEQENEGEGIPLPAAGE
jgi:hypothetical protein